MIQAKTTNKYLRRRILWKATNRARASFVKRIENLWKRKLRAFLDGDINAINDALRITYVEVGGRFGRATKKKLSKSKAFGDINEELDKELAEYATLKLGKLTRSIQNNTNRLSNNIIATEGLTTSEQITLLDEMIARRAKIITQHEIISASIVGSDIGADQASIEFNEPVFKTWIATIDDRVRDAHEFADGQTVAIKARFNVNGEALLRPRDISGSPGNTINCRCVMDYTFAQ